jgi:large subunit ribosomal protein L25
MSAITLEAENREKTGKGAARTLRRDGRIPAIIYGAGADEVKISLERRALNVELNKGGFTSRIVELKLGKDTIKALPRDVQFHPVTDQPEHADFLRVTADSKINVWVRLEFKGRESCIGIKRGGVLNIVRHEVELLCSPDAIPTSIIVNLKDIGIGESVHIEDVNLPDGVTPAIQDRNFTLATLAGRAKEEDLDAAVGGATAAEEGAEEGEEAAAEGGEAAAAEENPAE